jgi:hypothetical protein
MPLSWWCYTLRCCEASKQAEYLIECHVVHAITQPAAVSVA